MPLCGRCFPEVSLSLSEVPDAYCHLVSFSVAGWSFFDANNVDCKGGITGIITSIVAIISG